MREYRDEAMMEVQSVLDAHDESIRYWILTIYLCIIIIMMITMMVLMAIVFQTWPREVWLMNDKLNNKIGILLKLIEDDWKRGT